MLKQLKGLSSAMQSAVLGTQISREYDLGRQVASSGPGCMWRVYNAVHKANGKTASVFIFDKRSVEKLDRRERELLYDMLRRDPLQLAKLRHPRILELRQPLEETPTEMVFATEPINFCLGNLLGHHENLSPLPLAIKEYDLSDLDRQIGFLQLVTGLEFCHKSAKLLHGNLIPEAVFIDSKGDWKLGGFNFSVHLGYAGEADKTANTFKEYDDHMPIHTQPSLNYLAPERGLEANHSVSITSDIFALGVLLYSTWNEGKPVQECNSNLLTYKQNTSTLSRASLSGLPRELTSFVRRMISVRPEDRPTAEDVLNHDYFNNIVVLTLGFLQTLVEKDNVEKAEFFKGLPRLLPKIPRRTQLTKVLTHLLDELVNPPQAPFVLPNVFLIAETLDNSEFRNLILPSFIEHKLFSMKEPPEVLYLLMQKMDLFLQKAPADTLNTYIFPMVYYSLETTSYKLQELTLALLPTFAETMDYSVFKNSVFPRICTLCLETDSLSVRVKSLVCFSKLFTVLDKWTTTERLIPTLQEIPSREPGVLMAICGVFCEMVKSKKLALDKETIARKIIPFLAPLSIDGGLNPTQFKTFINVLHQLVSAIDVQQGSKLSQLDEMEATRRDQRTGESTLGTLTEPDDKRMAELLGKRVSRPTTPSSPASTSKPAVTMNQSSSSRRPSTSTSKPMGAQKPTPKVNVSMTSQTNQSNTKQTYTASPSRPLGSGAMKPAPVVGGTSQVQPKTMANNTSSMAYKSPMAKANPSATNQNRKMSGGGMAAPSNATGWSNMSSPGLVSSVPQGSNQNWNLGPSNSDQSNMRFNGGGMAASNGMFGWPNNMGGQLPMGNNASPGAGLGPGIGMDSGYGIGGGANWSNNSNSPAMMASASGNTWSGGLTNSNNTGMYGGMGGASMQGSSMLSGSGNMLGNGMLSNSTASSGMGSMMKPYAPGGMDGVRNQNSNMSTQRSGQQKSNQNFNNQDDLLL